MNNSFVGLIIFIGEQSHPSIAQTLFIDSKAMILRSDEASSSVRMSAWLVVTSVTVSQLKSRGSGSFCQQLMAKTNAKNWLWFGFVDDFGESLNDFLAH